MANGGGRLPFPAKMNVFEAEISCDQGFMTHMNANAGTVVPDPNYSPPASSAETHSTNEGFFGKGQDKANDIEEMMR
jgi:hypothetical protein